MYPALCFMKNTIIFFITSCPTHPCMHTHTHSFCLWPIHHEHLYPPPPPPTHTHTHTVSLTIRASHSNGGQEGEGESLTPRCGHTTAMMDEVSHQQVPQSLHVHPNVPLCVRLLHQLHSVPVQQVLYRADLKELVQSLPLVLYRETGAVAALWVLQGTLDEVVDCVTRGELGRSTECLLV